MRAARIYRPAELIGGKINHLQVQACHSPAKGCLLGWGQRCHTLATQPRMGRACGRGDRGELCRSPRICPGQEGRHLGRRPAVNRCWREEFRTQCARDGGTAGKASRGKVLPSDCIPAPAALTVTPAAGASLLPNQPATLSSVPGFAVQPRERRETSRICSAHGLTKSWT